MSEQHKNSGDDERARALSMKLFLIVVGAVAAFASAVIFYVL